ncbi:MAG: amidohydrolase family protein [Desulfobacterium sp.]|jgi:guanine deaminase|nr:amidohydrolase family protein [Desulfobacterium sp.]
MKSSLIVKGNFIYTPTADSYEIHGDSYLVCVHGRVEGIYPVIPDTFKGCTLHDYGNRLVIPGLVDLHLHAAQFLQCGMAMTNQLLSWLEDYTFDLEREFEDRAFARKAYTLFADKLVACGTLRSCIFASSSTPGTEELFEVLKKKGVAAYVGKVDMDTNAPDCIIETTREALRGTAYLLEKYKDEPLVKPIITPRFAPTSTPELLQGLGDLALKYDLPVQSHLSENMDEVRWVQDLFKHAENYSDVYFKNNLFGQTKTVMAHAIYLDDDEKAMVKRMNLMLAHCPDSNINVRSGIMPVRRYLDLGINIGLGSDIAGGHKIGMNEAMVRAIQLSKIVNMMDRDLKPLSVSEAFYMGTKGGGSFFGKSGSFEKGFFFDALVIEDDPMIAERYSLEDRLEKFIHVGDDRNICARYIEGEKL